MQSNHQAKRFSSSNTAIDKKFGYFCIANSVCSIVAYKKMFYIVGNRTFEQMLAVLRNENYVYLQLILASIMTVISIVM